MAGDIPTLRDEWPEPIKANPSKSWCVFDTMPDNRNLPGSLEILKQDKKPPTARLYMEMPDGGQWIIDFGRAALKERIERRIAHGLDCTNEQNALTILKLIPQDSPV